MKKLLSGVLAITVIVMLVALAPQDGLEQAIVKLQMELGELSLRVGKLEHATGQAPTVPAGGGGGATSAAASPSRSMILVGISKSDHPSYSSDEIAQQQRTVGALMNTVNASADQTFADLGQGTYVAHARGGARGWRGGVGGGYAETNRGSIGREVWGDNEITKRYETQMAIQKQKLEQMQHSAAQLKQIITGHNGDTIFTLESKFDISTSLKNIAIGDTVTWTGTRLSADQGGEIWEIDSINKVGG